MTQGEPSTGFNAGDSETTPTVMTDERSDSLPPAWCIHHFIEFHAQQSPEAIAILAPGRPSLTFGRLYQHMVEMVGTLNRMGFGRGDRVGVILPNGPEMAVAFLAVAAGMACAPLNPASTAGDCERSLTNLGVKAVIIQAGLDSPAREVARACGIPVVDLSPAFAAAAGLFTLAGEERAPAAHGGLARPEDVALVLHTSGTAAHPKIVPLTHRNLCAAVHGAHAVLPLSRRDRCLNVIPLFHIYGLSTVVLLSVATGGSVVCTPGFSLPEFFAWLEDFRPTVYAGSPTIHQAILAQAERHRDTIRRCSLRFIRSGSAPLSVQVMTEFERVFNAPVIEGYGMTEAPRVTLSPLLPGKRKVGSVGIPAGPEVAIVDEAIRFLPPKHVGEIVVRGASVFHGYENDPAATAAALVDGWFRTGDQGYLDEEGYLFITGRLKDLINRGGQKVSPREVDDVLRQHQAVAEAVTFAVPHATLGEDVAAAVVLRENAVATAEEVRAFAAQRLTSFKVPRQIVILDEIPKGPTGKPQRIGLAEKLGLTAPNRLPAETSADRPAGGTSGGRVDGETTTAADGSPSYPARGCGAPQDRLEAQLTTIWETVLGSRPIGLHDNFFDLGGNSLHAVQLFAQIEQILGKSLAPTTLLQASTIEQLASVLRQEGWSATWSSLIAIQPGGSKRPFFWIHALGGHVLCYRNLARYLDPNQPVYALQARGLDGRQAPDTSVEEMAAAYVKAIRGAEPAGPYFLGGLSFGGTVAFEMAHQLRAQGQQVALLALFDTYAPGYHGAIHRTPWPRSLFYRWLQSVDFHRGNLATLESTDRSAYVRDRARTMVRRIKQVSSSSSSAIGRALPRAFHNVQAAHRHASAEYVPRVYPGRLTLFRASKQPLGDRADPALGWERFAAGGVDAYEVPGYHASIIVEPNVRILARHLADCLGAAQRQQA